MHCDCCDRLLSDSEATAKFESGAYVNMCTKCVGFLPKEVKILTRSDLENEEDDEFYDDLEEDDGDEEDREE
jgi:hypothetical protein